MSLRRDRVRINPLHQAISRSLNRSRSRDTTRSSAAASRASLNTLDSSDSAMATSSVPENAALSQNQSAFAQNLQNAATASLQRDSAANIPLPAFLQNLDADLGTKWDDLTTLQNQRNNEGGKALPEDGTEPSPWVLPREEVVVKRNRYINIHPYDNNRVHLKVPEGVSDYINASPVHMDTATGEHKYWIVTQGPVLMSKEHFWHMIWQECGNPAVIVMLTLPHEGGKEKCYPYYPDTSTSPVEITEHPDFHEDVSYTITLMNTIQDDATQSTIREIEMKRDEETKTVWHIIFPGWPDFGVPMGPAVDAMLNVIAVSNEKNTAPDSPRVIHCSAGVGRSGTFVALELLRIALETGEYDDIEKLGDRDPILECIDRLREQRMLMVQSYSQFMFLYAVIKNWWVERYDKGVATGEIQPSPPKLTTTGHDTHDEGSIASPTTPQTPHTRPGTSDGGVALGGQTKLEERGALEEELAANSGG